MGAFNLDIMLILCMLLLMGNIWFMVSFLRFGRMVEGKLQEALARRK